MIHFFIPARAGSKRVENKNLRILRNRSLLQIAVEYALKQGVEGNIYVSTDIEESVIGLKEITYLRRPHELACASARLVDVLVHHLNELGLDNDDIVCILMPTAPLRVSSDFTEALRLFNDQGRAGTILSVHRCQEPPELMWQEGKDRFLVSEMPSSGKEHSRKQSYRLRYGFNECIVLDSVKNWKTSGRSLFGDRPIGLKCDISRSISIDYEDQLKMVERLFPPFDERNGAVEWDY